MRITAILSIIVLLAYAAVAQTTEFTYQGKLSDNSIPANANYDLQFQLYDAALNGNLIGTQILTDVVVANGIFTVKLNFGSQFNGVDRFLSISVKPVGGPTYTLLNPRQQITSAPYAIRSAISSTSDMATQADLAFDSNRLGGVSANQYVITTDPRMTDARIPTAGSSSYIQNRTTTQSSTNFNISGTGSANTFNAATQYNIGGNTVLSVSGNNTVVVGGNTDTAIAPNLLQVNTLGGDGETALCRNSTNQIAKCSAGSSQFDLSLVGSLRWDLLAAPKSYSVGSFPAGMAFDGKNIWIANNGGNSVTKLRASDAAVQGTFSVGTQPHEIAFDGANIWVVNEGSDNVTKLRASDGVVLGTFAVGLNPLKLAFDGTNIWVSNSNSNTVTKLRASDGTLQGTFGVGTFPIGVAFDGINIWVANKSSKNVTKLRAIDGVVQGTFSLGLISQPYDIAFDGIYIWITDGIGKVSRLKASDGSSGGNFDTGGTARGIAFDGKSIWVSGDGTTTLSKLSAGDGSLIALIPVGIGGQEIVFDGANIWVTYRNDNIIKKLPVFP